MKPPLSSLWAGIVFAAVAAQLSAQDETKPVVLDWLYVDLGPVALKQDLPAYPTKLVKRGSEGTVTVTFVVNAQGIVEEITVPQATLPAFGEAAASAVARWKFTPAEQGGQPVSTRLQAPFSFDDHGRVKLLISLASYAPFTGQIVRGADVTLASPKFQPKPAYPKELSKQKAGGQAVLSCVVVSTGDVANVRLVSATHPALAVAASNALLRWKFEPATLHGEPVSVAFVVPFEFSATEDGK